MVFVKFVVSVKAIEVVWDTLKKNVLNLNVILMAENWVHSRSCVLSRESVTRFIVDPVFYPVKVQVGIKFVDSC